MPKHRVLDIGNCSPDHESIRKTLQASFDVDVVGADGPDDAMKLLKDAKFDLVLINRKLDRDYSDGIEVMKLIQSNDKLASVPMMLITNFQEHQQLAIAAGAIRGFGKLQLDAPETIQRLSEFLS